MTQRVHLWVMPPGMDYVIDAVCDMNRLGSGDQYVLLPEGDDSDDPDDLRRGDLIVVEDSFPGCILDLTTTPEKAAEAGCVVVTVGGFLALCRERTSILYAPRPERPNQVTKRRLDL